MDGLAEAASSLVMGDPTDEATELGPLVSAAQRERVAGFVDRAVAGGARVVTGGGVADGPGFYYQAEPGGRRRRRTRRSPRPRCSARWSPCSNSATRPRRSPGPTTSTSACRPSVWTRDVGRAHRVANALRFGTVWVNDHGPLVSEMPHGGFKQSGMGKDMSAHSLEHYTELKHVMINLG